MNVEYLSFRSKRQFGVEIEVNRQLSSASLSGLVSTVVGRGHCYVDGWGYTCGNRDWIVKPDSSCGDQGDKNVDGGGFEVVSAVGKGVKHLQQIADVTDALKEGKAKINKYCGLHCQVEIEDFSSTQAATLLAHWCRIEPFFSHTVPLHRTKSKHCRLHTTSKAFITARRARIRFASDFWSYMKLKQLGASAKRNTMTLVNYQRSRSTSGEWDWFHRPTAELRYPDGSLESYDVKNWVRLFIHFVETCAKRDFPSSLAPVRTISQFLGVLGLNAENDITVLSPGLFETKCWLLHRIRHHCQSPSVLQDTISYWQRIYSDDIKWKYDFPQVLRPKKPKKAATLSFSTTQQANSTTRPYVEVSELGYGY